MTDPILGLMEVILGRYKAIGWALSAQARSWLVSRLHEWVKKPQEVGVPKHSKHSMKNKAQRRFKLLEVGAMKNR